MNAAGTGSPSRGRLPTLSSTYPPTGHCAPDAGTPLLADTANTLGVTDTLNEHLAGLTPAAVTHSPGAVLSSVAVALTAGATCLDDLDLLTPLAATGLVTPLPSTATAHRRIHQLADTVDRVNDRLPQAMHTLRTRAWDALGELNPTATMSRDNPLISIHC